MTVFPLFIGELAKKTKNSIPYLCPEMTNQKGPNQSFEYNMHL
jgi:hypothetical protein